MKPKKICVEHEIAVNSRVETHDPAEWRLSELGMGETNMTPTELRKASKWLAQLNQDSAACLMISEAMALDRDAHAEQIERRALERMDVPVTVRAGQLAQALHWIEDHAFLSDKPVPDGVRELMRVIANVHMELLEGIA